MKKLKLLLNNITASLDAGEGDVFKTAKNKIKNSSLKLCPLSCSIYKKSVDARKKDNIKLVYSVCVECEAAEDFNKEALSNTQFSVIEENTLNIVCGKKQAQERIIVVGMGPAGMFCALLLAEYGFKPLLIERGDSVDLRIQKKEQFYQKHILDTESNIQFGAGGAGTFSDGKLITRVNDPLSSYVIRRLVEFGAPSDILSRAKPHVGTDNLCNIVKNIDSRIKALGGEILYRTRLDDIIFGTDGQVKSIVVNNNTNIACSSLVLCLGHSARDTYKMLLSKDVIVTPKPFSVGVRIEHLREDIDRALYGRYAGHSSLGAAEYNLSYNTKERGVYTFCMCPGGEVVAAASEENSVVVNGMSNYKRDGVNSNCAVAVSVFESDYGSNPLGAIEYQRNLEKLAFSAGGTAYAVPITTVGDFFEKRKSQKPTRVKPTYMNGENCTLSDFHSFMSEFLYNSLSRGLSDFNKKIDGFADKNAILSAFETRTSAPLRIVRNENRVAIGHSNLYPCGEGAGYAGGITSAAIDGLRSAIEIISIYAPVQ